MTTASNLNGPEVRYIYESPDGGKTVYKREMGSDKRVIVVQEGSEWDIRQRAAARANRLLTILRLSEEDPTLNDALEQLEALYILKYGDDENN